MTRRKTYSRTEFMILTILLFSIMMRFYLEDHYRYALSTSVGSLCLLIVLCSFSFVIGDLLCSEWDLNLTNALATVLLPFAVYAMISYFRKGAALICFIAAVTAAIAVFRCLRILLRTRSFFSGHRQRVKLYIVQCLRLTRITFAYGLSVFLFLLAVSPYIFEEARIQAEDLSAYGPHGEEYTISYNLPELENLRQEQWAELDRKEKLDTLRTAADIESNYLGLPYLLRLEATSQTGENELGYYDVNLHSIFISENALNELSARECLEIVCHEAYHAYEREVIKVLRDIDKDTSELLFFREAQQWQFEFQNYQGESDTVWEYYDYLSQAVEQDAFEYANDAVEDYYSRLYPDF